MSDLPERRPPQEMAVNAVGAAFATMLGFVVLPAGPLAVAAAGAMLTPYATRMVELAAAEWQRKSDLIAETAVAASGLGDEEFCAKLSGNPDLIALAQKILWAASVSGNEQKLRTFGQLLGGAVKDGGDRLDEAQVLAAALADLEAPHVVVLDILTRPAPDPELSLAGAGRTHDPGWWLSSQVVVDTPMEPVFVHACLNMLTRHGLAISSTRLGVPAYSITKLGTALANVMRQARRPLPHED